MAYLELARESSIDYDDWHFDRVYQFGGCVAVWITYHGSRGSRNDGWSQILIYETCTEQMLIDQGTLDPNFSTNKNYLSPVAKFEPTERGWTWAIVWVECM